MTNGGYSKPDEPGNEPVSAGDEQLGSDSAHGRQQTAANGPLTNVDVDGHPQLSSGDLDGGTPVLQCLPFDKAILTESDLCGNLTLASPIHYRRSRTAYSALQWQIGTLVFV